MSMTPFSLSRSCVVLTAFVLVSASALAANVPPPIPKVPAQEKKHPHSIALWPGGAPGSEAKKDQKEIVNWRQEPDIVFPVTCNIHNPSVTPYLPSRRNATGTVVIIAPGGAHRFLTTDREGYDVGEWLSGRGIAGFVLKYRLARDDAGGSTYKVDVEALADMQRAVRLVRNRAKEWNINPGAIGVLGFSAGGEVAALAGMRYDNGNEGAADPADRVSCRPDFQVLVYPGGLRNVNPTRESPPAFLACAYDDRPEISEGLANTWLKFKQVGVPAELHIYAKGGHGFGVRNRPLAVSSWPSRLQQWMADLGFLKRQ